MKNKPEKGFCPVCEREISFEPAGKINYDLGGWQEECTGCRAVLLILVYPEKKIVVISDGSGFRDTDMIEFVEKINLAPQEMPEKGESV